MKALLTKQNDDGTYDECGMNNQHITSAYRTERGLRRYGLGRFKGLVRVKMYNDNDIYRNPDAPFKTFYTMGKGRE